MATILLKCAMHCASNSSFLSSSGSSSIFLLLMPSVWCVMINSAKTDPECYFSCFSLGKRSLELETEFLGQILFPNDGLSDSIIWEKQNCSSQTKRPHKVCKLYFNVFRWKILMRENALFGTVVQSEVERSSRVYYDYINHVTDHEWVLLRPRF